MQQSVEARLTSWPQTTLRNARGELEIGGVSLADLAGEYGTPLYIFDEATLRARARLIRDTFASAFPDSRILYAGKAYLSPSLMHILAQEEIGLDVVSGGEIYAGLLAGLDPARMVFHGNNKSRRELEEAVAAGVGLIAIDNALEISQLEAVAAQFDRVVRVILRLNPGVDPHTHHKMRTGAADSKFGFPIWDGQADAAAEVVSASRWFQLEGYHAHVGSQIFDPTLVEQTIHAILMFAAGIRDRLGVSPSIVIPGGGFGVADDASGNDVSIDRWAQAAAGAVRRGCDFHNLAFPTLAVEPGRAIIGPTGVALYEVGSQKQIPGVRKYVSVDGGMADNIRPALYGARYSVTVANRDPSGEPLESVTVAGKYCESGDILIDNAELPAVSPGDLLVLPMCGAYCLAMASNYNMSPRPAAVLVSDGKATLIRRRETYDDLLHVERLPELAGDPVVRSRLSQRNGSL